MIYALPKFSRKGYIGFDTSDDAKFRFHVLEVFYASGWKGVSVAFPKLKRATLCRWKKKYEASGKRLDSLLPKSTRPHHIRVMLTPPSVVALITQWYKVHTIQTDNGSELESYFERVSKENNLTHLWNYPKHPKTTGFVERFNWTIQDEFLFDTEDYLLYPEEFQTKLSTWITWYNQVRPHQSLGYLSPYQYLQERRLSQKY